MQFCVSLSLQGFEGEVVIVHFIHFRSKRNCQDQLKSRTRWGGKGRGRGPKWAWSQLAKPWSQYCLELYDSSDERLRHWSSDQHPRLPQRLLWHQWPKRYESIEPISRVFPFSHSLWPLPRLRDLAILRNSLNDRILALNCFWQFHETKISGCYGEVAEKVACAFVWWFVAWSLNCASVIRRWLPYAVQAPPYKAWSLIT